MGRGEGADGDAIAAAAGAVLDTLSLPPSRTVGLPEYDQRPCVAIYRSLPHEPPTQALATMLQARRTRVIRTRWSLISAGSRKFPASAFCRARIPRTAASRTTGCI